MTKSQIMDQLAEANGMTKKATTEFMESMMKMAYKESGNGFSIPGLGKLVVVDRKARMCRNPATGEPLHIPAKMVLKFRIAKAAKDAIME